MTPIPDPLASPPVLLTLHSSRVLARGETDAAWDTSAIAAGQTNFGYDALSDGAGGAFVMWGDIRAYATSTCTTSSRAGERIPRGRPAGGCSPRRVAPRVARA